MSSPPATDQYEAITHNIRVLVEPRFLEEQSVPHSDRYVWAYTVMLENEGEATVQLKTRTWLITDGNGNSETVHGPGVVGEQPILRPGDRFQYTSGCPLKTPTGFMVGNYSMQAEDGSSFDIDIPAFALDHPDAPRTMN